MKSIIGCSLVNITTSSQPGLLLIQKMIKFHLQGPQINGENIFVCGQKSCFNGGRCDPITQKCKCKGHHTGHSKSLLKLQVRTVIIIRTLEEKICMCAYA